MDDSEIPSPKPSKPKRNQPNPEEEKSSQSHTSEKPEVSALAEILEIDKLLDEASHKTVRPFKDEDVHFSKRITPENQKSWTAYRKAEHKLDEEAKEGDNNRRIKFETHQEGVRNRKILLIVFIVSYACILLACLLILAFSGDEKMKDKAMLMLSTLGSGLGAYVIAQSQNKSQDPKAKD